MITCYHVNCPEGRIEFNNYDAAAKRFYEVGAPATLTSDSYRNNLGAGYELVSSEVILEK